MITPTMFPWDQKTLADKKVADKYALADKKVADKYVLIPWYSISYPKMCHLCVNTTW